MGAAVGLREDFGVDELRRLAARAKDAAQARRLLALAAVRDGMNRTEAARIGGMDRQTLRDWVHRFNQHGVANHQIRRAEMTGADGSPPSRLARGFIHLRCNYPELVPGRIAYDRTYPRFSGTCFLSPATSAVWTVAPPCP
jgi:hypothetical protein